MISKVNELINTDLPILIVGWDKVKTLFPNQKITNKRISDNILWTFKEKEKKTDNEIDLVKFNDFCVKIYENKYKYFFLNPFEITFTQLKKLINKINPESLSFFYYDEQELFFLVENVIFGINFDFIKYTTVKKEKLINWFLSKNFKFVENSLIFNIKNNILVNKKYLFPSIMENFNYEKKFIIGYILE